MCTYVYVCGMHVFMHILYKAPTIYTDGIYFISLIYFVLLHPKNNLSGIIDGAHKLRLQASFAGFYIVHGNEICTSLFMSTQHELYISWQ